MISLICCFEMIVVLVELLASEQQHRAESKQKKEPGDWVNILINGHCLHYRNAGNGSCGPEIILTVVLRKL